MRRFINVAGTAIIWLFAISAAVVSAAIIIYVGVTS